MLIEKLRETGEFPILQRRYLITGMLSKGQVGSDVNSVFHVLLHEIAHTSVTEYQHSGHFWDNLHKLKAVAGRIGIYKGVTRKPYCGHHISD